MPKLNAFQTQKGWIEVICGPMFSGKSEELFRRINLLKYADVEYLIFTPHIDTRSGLNKAKSRNGITLNTISIKNSKEIITNINNFDKKIQVIGIDEAQFFDDELADVCNYLANNGYVIIVAGLDMDSFCKPFVSMMKLLIYADHITKLKAICTKCGAKANLTDTFKSRSEDKQILIGNENEYVARCRQCHSKCKNNSKKFENIKKCW